MRRTKPGKATQSERGIALILTLAILVIATILVVGFVTSMRTERQATTSMANNASASVLASTALDHAVAILDKNIPQPAPPGVPTIAPKNWIISPGLLTIVTGPRGVVQIPLSSGPAGSTPETRAELNVLKLSGTGHTLLPTADSLPVAWQPMLKDPSIAPSASNAISGRYAFWIDDETAKINLNTAFGKPSNLDFTKLSPGTVSVPNPSSQASTFPLGHPSSVNLDVLGGPIDTAGLESAIQLQRGLNSPDAIRPHVPAGSADAFVDSNRFNMTTNSRAPEFNVFGKSRLYFLRSATGALGRPLFQFFRDAEGPNYFPAEENLQAADRHSTYYTAAALSAYLNRNDWPGMPARSFVDKWTAGYTATAARREADQVAWNMMSLGSFASGGFNGPTASSNFFQLANAATSSEVGFVSINRPNKDAVLGSLSGKAMMPICPVPLINEVSVVILPEFYTIAGGTGKYRLKVSLNVELWLPPKFPPYDFQHSQVTVGMTYLYYRATQTTANANASQQDTKYVDRSASPNDNGIRKLWISNNVGAMNPGDYSQLSSQLPLYMKSPNVIGFSGGAPGSQDFEITGTISINFKMRLFALFQQASGGAGYGTKYTSQLVPVWDKRDPGTTAAPTSWNPSPPGTPVPALDVPPDDPDDPNDYLEFTFDLDPSQFGSSPQPYTRSLEIADPRMSGLAAKWQPAGDFTNNASNAIDSMGMINNATTAAAYDTQKLAFADVQNSFTSNRTSTGFLSILPSGMQRGIPGSTLKFQPSTSSSELPDWLLLDLIAPAPISANYPDAARMNATSGVINLNAKVTPAPGSLSRWQPLQGLLLNMSGVSGTTSPSPTVTNILNHTTAGVDFGAPGVYDYVGEICEISGVSNTGASDWDKEAIIRNLAGSMTTKSNVFSVWGIAQTVKKRSSNTAYGTFEAGDVITGEKRFQAIVERYVWPGNDASSGNAHTSSAGNYDSLSTGQAAPGSAPAYVTTGTGPQWEVLDGPNAPTYPPPNPPTGTNIDPWVKNGGVRSPTALEAADNPVGALMKYHVIYFKYLEE